jgi:hypothetical protein
MKITLASSELESILLASTLQENLYTIDVIYSLNICFPGVFSVREVFKPYVNFLNGFRAIPLLP